MTQIIIKFNQQNMSLEDIEAIYRNDMFSVSKKKKKVEKPFLIPTEQPFLEHVPFGMEEDKLFSILPNWEAMSLTGHNIIFGVQFHPSADGEYTLNELERELKNWTL